MNHTIDSTITPMDTNEFINKVQQSRRSSVCTVRLASEQVSDMNDQFSPPLKCMRKELSDDVVTCNQNANTLSSQQDRDWLGPPIVDDLVLYIILQFTDFRVSRLVSRRWCRLSSIRHARIRPSPEIDFLEAVPRLLQHARTLSIEQWCHIPPGDSLALAKLRKLRSLQLTQVGAPLIVDVLQHMRKLRELEIRLSSLRDDDVAPLAKLTRLASLKIVACNCTTKALHHLTPLGNTLKSLSFIHNNFINVDLAFLHDFHCLEALVLTGARLNKTQLALVVTQCPALLELRFSSLYDEGAMDMLHRLPKLRTLQFGGLHKQEAYKTLGELTKLEELSIWWQPTGDVPAFLSRALEKLTNLQTLDLSPGLFSYATLPANLPTTLSRLTLNGLTIDDSLLTCKKLETLALFHCPVSDDVIEPVHTLVRCGSLRNLILEGTTYMAEKTKAQLYEIPALNITTPMPYCGIVQ